MKINKKGNSTDTIYENDSSRRDTAHVKNQPLRSSLGDLPNEIQIKILTFADDEELVLEFPNVNKLFSKAFLSLITLKRAINIKIDEETVSKFLKVKKIRTQ